MLDSTRWGNAIKALVDEDTVAAQVKADFDALQPGGDGPGPSGTTYLRVLIRRVVDAVADAVAGASATEISTNAVVTVPVEATDSGLQSYAAGGPPAPTAGPLAPASLDGSIS